MAFRIGAMKAYADGYDYLAYADDDAYPAGNALELLEENASEGHEIAGACYSSGRKADVTNHYCLISRNVMKKAGFHFSGFFMQCDDFELMHRLMKVSQPFFDPRIRVEHRLKPLSDSRAVYLMARNMLACMGMTLDFSRYLPGSIHLVWLSTHRLLIMGKPGYMRACLLGIRDFLSGRNGPPPPLAERWEMPETDPGAIHGALFIPANLAGDAVPFDISAMESWSVPWACSGRKANPIAIIMACAGRDVVLDGESMWTYPYLTMLARDVHVYRWDEGKVRFMCRNDMPKAMVAALLAAPASLLAIPAFVLLALAKRGTYTSMLRESLDDGSEFCRRADRELDAQSGRRRRRAGGQK
jgi:hypothetical protein